MCVLRAVTNCHLLYPLLFISLVTTSLGRNDLTFTSGQGCGIEHEIITQNIGTKNCTVVLSYREPPEPSRSRKSNNNIFSPKKVATTVKDKEKTDCTTIANTVKEKVETQVNAVKAKNKIEKGHATSASTVNYNVETLQASITSSETTATLEKMVTTPKTMTAAAFAEVIQSTASRETITVKPITMPFKDKVESQQVNGEKDRNKIETDHSTIASTVKGKVETQQVNVVKGKDKIENDRSTIESTVKRKIETLKANTTPLRTSTPSATSENTTPSRTSTPSEKIITPPKTIFAATFTEVIQLTVSGETTPVKPVNLGFTTLYKSKKKLYAAGNVKMLYRDSISMCEKQADRFATILDKANELGIAYQRLVEASSKYAKHFRILQFTIVKIER